MLAFWLFRCVSNDASDVDGLTALSIAVKATEAKRESFTKNLLPLTLKRSFHSLAQIKSDDRATLKLAKLNAEDLVQVVSRRHSILFSQERESRYLNRNFQPDVSSHRPICTFTQP